LWLVFKVLSRSYHGGTGKETRKSEASPSPVQHFNRIEGTVLTTPPLIFVREFYLKNMRFN